MSTREGYAAALGAGLGMTFGMLFGAIAAAAPGHRGLQRWGRACWDCTLLRG